MLSSTRCRHGVHAKHLHTDTCVEESYVCLSCYDAATCTIRSTYTKHTHIRTHTHTHTTLPTVSWSLLFTQHLQQTRVCMYACMYTHTHTCVAHTALLLRLLLLLLLLLWLLLGDCKVACAMQPTLLASFLILITTLTVS